MSTLRTLTGRKGCKPLPPQNPFPETAHCMGDYEWTWVEHARMNPATANWHTAWWQPGAPCP